MGLLRGLARTAAIAGTATAVSNRVSRRQAGRWAAKEQKADEEQLAQQQPQYAEQQPQYAQQQPQYAQPQYAPPPAAPSTDDMLEQLQKLGELKEAGVLTEAEFQAQKAKILAR
jgi:phosphoglycolate phosphatase-like HAD superfamily hydrolase